MQQNILNTLVTGVYVPMCVCVCSVLYYDYFLWLLSGENAQQITIHFTFKIKNKITVCVCVCFKSVYNSYGLSKSNFEQFQFDSGDLFSLWLLVSSSFLSQGL